MFLNPVQQYLKDWGIAQIIIKTNNNISIGEIKLYPFNRLDINNLYLSDLKGDTLLNVKNIKLEFSLWDLIAKHQINLKDVCVEDFFVAISQDSANAPMNFQFLIDAFASDGSQKEDSTKGFDLNIEQLSIANGSLSFNITDQEQVSEGFDYSHIQIKDCYLQLSLNALEMKDWEVDIKQMKLREKTNLHIVDLNSKLSFIENRLSISTCNIKFPLSSIQIKELAYNIPSEISDTANKPQQSQLALKMNSPTLYLSDFASFFSPLESFDEAMQMELDLRGELPHLQIEKFILQDPYDLKLDLQAASTNISEPENAAFELSLKELFLSPRGFDKWSQFFIEDQETPIKIQNNISINGRIDGNLADFDLLANLNVKKGKINIDAKCGYIPASGDAKFNIKSTLTNFNPNDLYLVNTILGKIDMQIIARGELYKSGKINGAAEIKLRGMEFDKNHYKDLYLNALYKGQKLNAKLTSKNAKIPIDAELNFDNTNPKEPLTELKAKLNHLHINRLNRTSDNSDDSIKTSDVYVSINARAKGINPNKMSAEIHIDSLNISNGDKNFVLNNKPSLHYNAIEANEKEILLCSDIMEAQIRGIFDFEQLPIFTNNLLSTYLPKLFPLQKTKLPQTGKIEFQAIVPALEKLSSNLELAYTSKEESTIEGYLDYQKNTFALRAVFPLLEYSGMPFANSIIDIKTDTSLNKVSLDFSTCKIYTSGDSLKLKLVGTTEPSGASIDIKFDNETPNMNLNGHVLSKIQLPLTDKNPENILKIEFLPSTIKMNQQSFLIAPSSLSIKENNYAVNNFKISLSEDEYFKINGLISANAEDTLKVWLSNLRLATFLEAAKSDLVIGGLANGEVLITKSLLSPHIITKDLEIKNISFQDLNVGNLSLASVWDEKQEGLQIRALLENDSLKNGNAHRSTLEGYIKPSKDSISLIANLESIDLRWLSPLTEDYLFLQEGILQGKISAEGRLSEPELNGVLGIQNGLFGLSLTQTKYSISDSISILPNKFVFNDIKIKDENGKIANVNGSIEHQEFAAFQPKIKINLDDFLVLNNPHQSDSLFYGTLRLNDSIEISGTEKNILLKMKLSNSGKSSIFVNMPSARNTALRSQGMSFVNKNDSLLKEDLEIAQKIAQKTQKFPLKLDMSLRISPDLRLGTCINPQTRDMASVVGIGNIDLAYDLTTDRMNLFGDYSIQDGECDLTLANVSKKKFTIKPGGSVAFLGDPMASIFDVTAVYGLKTDLTSLSPSFGSDESQNTRTQVDCLIKVAGSMDKMNISYDIELPQSDESIQKKVAGILYSDDEKMKEIAYLLAVGSFYSPQAVSGSRSTGNKLWTSLASASLSNQLNNLLSGVFKDNWTIGTKLYSQEQGNAGVEMEVELSTSLFKDRLQANSSTSTRNFASDFDFQYKLNRSGSLVVKMYNVTNDQFYDQGLSTQGLSFIYKKEGKTFRSLFRNVRKKLKK
ncbi:DUF490 domain-containing protein [Bacteroidales bacterium]|nr:DUF490 domain-containing protein [Bacteroidales bacterium]